MSLLPHQVEGRAYPRLSSRQVAATLKHRAVMQSESEKPDDLFIDILDREGVVLGGAPLSQIEVDWPIGRQPRKLTLPDGTVFETDDHDAIGQIVGESNSTKLHRLEQFHPRLIAFVLACMVGVWVIYRYGLDILVAFAIWLTPPVLVAQIDKGTMATIDFQMAEASRLDANEQARVEDIFATLLPHIEDVPDGTNFQLLFRDMPGMGPNAFALPGGTVVMTDAFIRDFPDEDVLASVLGHEIGHVVERHGMRQLYRSLTVYILIALMAGDTGPFLEEILLEGNVLLSLSFSRAHERAADEFGVKLADRAGYDPAGLKIFFDEISKKFGEPPRWLSTHPGSKERAADIDGYIEALP